MLKFRTATADEKSHTSLCCKPGASMDPMLSKDKKLMDVITLYSIQADQCFLWYEILNDRFSCNVPMFFVLVTLLNVCLYQNYLIFTTIS